MGFTQLFTGVVTIAGTLVLMIRVNLWIRCAQRFMSHWNSMTAAIITASAQMYAVSFTKSTPSAPSAVQLTASPITTGVNICQYSVSVRRLHVRETQHFAAFCGIEIHGFFAVLGYRGIQYFVHARRAGSRTRIDPILSMTFLAMTVVLAAVISCVLKLTLPRVKKAQKNLDELSRLSAQSLSGARVIRAFSKLLCRAFCRSRA